MSWNVTGTRKSLLIKITITLADGSELEFRESDIIKCVVSLRSDLSVDNPTLPESEIEAEIYSEDLMGATIADLPDETPLVYTTAFRQDEPSWFFNRYFYVDEASWEKNILKIHARDQVHKLDDEMPPIYIGQRWLGEGNRATSRGLRYLAMVFCDCINGTAKNGWESGDIIEHISFPTIYNYEGYSSSGDQVNAILPRATRRENIAKLMNLCRFDMPSGFLNNRDSWHLTYTDAGSPQVRLSKIGQQYIFFEDDCGDIQEYRDTNVSQYNFKVSDVVASSSTGNYAQITNASALAQKAKGIAMGYDDYMDYSVSGLMLGKYSEYYGGLFYLWQQDYADSYYTRARPYKTAFNWDYDELRINRYGYWLFDSDISKNPFNFTNYSYLDLSGSKWTSGGINSPASTWQDFIDAGAITAGTNETSLEVYGYFYVLANDRIIKMPTMRKGIISESEDSIWNGEVYAVGYSDTSKRIQVLPDMALQQLAKRSNLCGSFVHRAVTYLQPRMPFQFNFMAKNLMDQDANMLTDENGAVLVTGGYEYRTIENHTITHENGGTISEFTYRRGIV